MWCIHILPVEAGHKSCKIAFVVRLSTSLCADRQCWTVRAECWFFVSRTQSAAGVILILSIATSMKERTSAKWDTQTIVPDGVQRGCFQCHVVRQKLMKEGKYGLYTCRDLLQYTVCVQGEIENKVKALLTQCVTSKQCFSRSWQWQFGTVSCTRGQGLTHRSVVTKTG